MFDEYQESQQPGQELRPPRDSDVQKIYGWKECIRLDGCLVLLGRHLGDVVIVGWWE